MLTVIDNNNDDVNVNNNIDNNTITSKRRTTPLLLNGLPQQSVLSNIHRLLFIKDCLSAKLISNSNNDCLFQFGNPAFTFTNVRLLGIVVGITENIEIQIDDGTAVISLRPTPYKSVRIGDQIECLGSLCVDSTTSRYVQCYQITHKDDIMLELLRPLEMIRLYKNHYFPQSFNAGSTKIPSLPLEQTQQRSKFTVQQMTPAKQDRFRNTFSVSPFKPVASNNIDAMFKVPQPPIRKSDTNNNANDMDLDDVDDDDDDMVFTSASTGIEVDIETFLRNSQGPVILEDIKKRFPDASDDQLSAALDNVSC